MKKTWYLMKVSKIGYFNMIFFDGFQLNVLVLQRNCYKFSIKIDVKIIKITLS